MVGIITVYFSMKGETVAPGMKIVNLDKGNTAWAAEYVQKAVGGDLFELETVKTYLKDHMKIWEKNAAFAQSLIYPSQSDRSHA